MKENSSMKTKSVVELVVALLIFLVAAYLIYTLLAPKSGTSKSSAATVTQVTPLATDFNSTALQSLGDSSQTKDFYSAPNLQSGLGNNQPFGQ
jgi:hypothetical protein